MYPSCQLETLSVSSIHDLIIIPECLHITDHTDTKKLSKLKKSLSYESVNPS